LLKLWLSSGANFNREQKLMKIESIEAPDIPPLRDENFVRFLAERGALMEYIDRVTGDSRNFLDQAGSPDPSTYIDNAFVWGTAGSPASYWDELHGEWLRVLSSMRKEGPGGHLGTAVCALASKLPAGTALHAGRKAHERAMMMWTYTKDEKPPRNTMLLLWCSHGTAYPWASGAPIKEPFIAYEDWVETNFDLDEVIAWMRIEPPK